VNAGKKDVEKPESYPSEQITTQAASVPKTPANPVDSVPLKVSVVLGSAQISLGKLASLGRGAILELDTKIGDPLGIYVNGKLIGYGDVVIKENNQAGIQISALASQEDR
jgi:flagellar motor switch protein FliN/FliY